MLYCLSDFSGRKRKTSSHENGSSEGETKFIPHYKRKGLLCKQCAWTYVKSIKWRKKIWDLPALNIKMGINSDDTMAK